jgi:hypothetical protein
MNFPQVHVAGDTLDFEVDVPDYPSSDGWTLTYYLTPRFSSPTQAQITITASANSDGSYQVQSSPTATAAWKPGAYGWARIVSKTGARQTLTGSDDQGELLVRTNPVGAAQGSDTRSHARKMLELIETALEAFGANPVMKSYAIGTRQYQRHEIPDLLVLRDRYRHDVASEIAAADIAAGQSSPRNVGIRFGRP